MDLSKNNVEKFAFDELNKKKNRMKAIYIAILVLEIRTFEDFIKRVTFC